MIDLRYVKKLIEMLDGSSVDSIEISSDKGMKLRISKTPQQRGAVPMAAPMQMPMLAMPSQSRLTPPEGMAALSEAAAGAVPAPAPPSLLLEVKSPMVGTFYSASDPSAPAFVAAGQRVTKGQIICIIEAMKIMNEIECEFDGVVREVLAENAHPVEYGQVLFRVDPNG